jgi:hypothetical protein
MRKFLILDSEKKMRLNWIQFDMNGDMYQHIFKQNPPKKLQNMYAAIYLLYKRCLKKIWSKVSSMAQKIAVTCLLKRMKKTKKKKKQQLVIN